MLSEQVPAVLPLFPDAPFDIVAMAASLGGLNALSQVLSALPPDFPAAIAIVQHLSSSHRSYFDEILARRTRLRVNMAGDGDALCAGTVYLAPPDHHLLVDPQRRLVLSQSAPVHFARPAADLLFQSVAQQFRERAIGVVLTGRLQDGAVGAQAIKQAGGRVIVQDALSAEAAGMPSAAIRTQALDFVLPLDKIAAALVSLVMVRGAAALLRPTSPLVPWLPQWAV